MPLDNLPTVSRADLIPPVPERPDARFLSRVLREGPRGPHWLAGFVWYYGDCRTCAMGLAACLWSELKLATYGMGYRECLEGVRKSNDLNSDDYYPVFIGLCFRLRKPNENITPKHVADALDTAIAQRDASAGAS